MKQFFCIILTLLLVVVVPISAFASGLDEEISPMAVITVNASFTKSSSISGKIYATTKYDSTIELVATAQLQRKVDGVWRNVGSAVTNSTTGKSITATKTVAIAPGYEYRVKGIHRIGVQTQYSYSGIIEF